MNDRYQLICVAGTFDGIHAGHEVLLRRTFEVGETVLIGLTSDDFPFVYKKPRVYAIRKQELQHWLHTNGYHAPIIPIDDPYGPAVTDESIDALVVSEETRARGEEINRKRKRPLVLIVVPLVKTEDGKKISSSDLRMPDALRSVLREPLGPIVRHERPGLSCVITVGDFTTKSLLDAGITPSLMIIDRKVNRKPYHEVSLTGVHVKSGPGFISEAAMKLIKDMPSGVIEVDGEEDLLVLPVIMEAPIGTLVYYGQPQKGMVEVVVTEQIKHKVRRLLNAFVNE